jgi:small ligand-binding sensory domain FIST
MNVGAGLSTDGDAGKAATEATRTALESLGGATTDLAVVFASRHHAAWGREILDAVHEVAAPHGLIGCVAEAVIGGGREIELAPAVSVWLGAMPGGAATFSMDFASADSGGMFAGWNFDGEGTDPSPVHLMICDPFSFPADLLLQHLNERDRPVPVVGGMASGGAAAGETVLFHDRDVVHEGAVGARLPGALAVRTLVSQGCRPFGVPLVVTRSRDNVLYELGGRPPLERLQEALEGLAPPDRELASEGLQMGRVIDEYRAEHGQGDFLVRAVLGVDPKTGAMAVGDRLAVGETVRFHVRDAATADEELRSLLELASTELGGPAAGALLFTCNGRGSRMFGTPNHDAGLVSSILGGAPLAGLFCAGELGPVGGRNFLHGFSASIAIFANRAPN